MTGRLFLVVGPSGVGKDSILNGAREALADDARFVFARRFITRDATVGGEDHQPISDAEFSAIEESGGFLFSWRAHGLSYGLPASLRDDLDAGRHVVANVSRAALKVISDAYSSCTVLEITASPAIVARRLRNRNRETEDNIKARLTRKAPPLPKGVKVVAIPNNGRLGKAVELFLSTLRSPSSRWLKLRRIPIDSWHENICFLSRDCAVFDAANYLGPGKVDVFNDEASIRAKVNLLEAGTLLAPDELGLSSLAFDRLGLSEGSLLTLERTPSPQSLRELRAKVAGSVLKPGQIDMIVKDITEDRYNGREISAFLVSASKHLELVEIEALCNARARYSSRIDWPYDIVVDKHSMGGVPGSRITMIVIPIVAAQGMVIPKTSSRAITSAAGTADVMEVVARVDLMPDEVKRVVSNANGCIAWNGNLNHSPIDDVMNSITRPLGIDSSRWAVASILSKKIAAGSSHVMIDIPVGPDVKTKTMAEGHELAALFETVAKRVGLEALAEVTDGTRPIGFGIGPALEVRDVYSVLRGHDDAPADLRAKALDFAGRILEWGPDVPANEGRVRAEALLNSGAALSALEKIVDAQGRVDHPVRPGPLIYEYQAERSGRIKGINPRVISRMARRAGAPMDKSAGIDILQPVGADVVEGTPLLLIHGSVEADLENASTFVQSISPIDIV